MPADSLQVTNSNEPDPANPVGCAPNCNYCFRRDAAGTGLLEDRAGGGTWNLLSGAPATLTATTGSCTGASPTGGFCPSLVTDNAAPPNTVGAAITLRLRFRIPETDSFQAMTFTTTIAARN